MGKVSKHRKDAFNSLKVQFWRSNISQRSMVFNHLVKKGTITSLEALSLYRIFRLAARIHDLRGDGNNIITKYKRDLTGKRYAQYWLI